MHYSVYRQRNADKVLPAPDKGLRGRQYRLDERKEINFRFPIDSSWVFCYIYGRKTTTSTEDMQMATDAANRNDFKAELKALLKKYNASISFGASDDSDWWGIHGEYLYATINGKDTRLCDGYHVTSSDIKTR